MFKNINLKTKIMTNSSVDFSKFCLLYKLFLIFLFVIIMMCLLQYQLYMFDSQLSIFIKVT